VTDALDRDILAATFQSRVRLAKVDLPKALEEASTEWEANRQWFLASTKAQGSFAWYCTEFDLEPSAVLKAVGLQ